jgi:cytochrome c-type biogenesis protein CcmE
VNGPGRVRLLVAFAVVAAVVGLAAVVNATSGPGTVTVEALLHDESLAGQRVSVEGVVVPGSRRTTASSVSFRMCDPGADEGPLPGAPSIAVVRNAPLPAGFTFVDGQKARATGSLRADGTFVADSLSLGPVEGGGGTAATRVPAP